MLFCAEPCHSEPSICQSRTGRLLTSHSLVNNSVQSSKYEGTCFCVWDVNCGTQFNKHLLRSYNVLVTGQVMQIQKQLVDDIHLQGALMNRRWLN